MGQRHQIDENSREFRYYFATMNGLAKTQKKWRAASKNAHADGLLAWLLLLVVLLITVDAFAGMDLPVRWLSLFLLGGALYWRSWSLVPCALLIFYLYVGSIWFPSWVWRVPSAPFLFPFLLTWITCLPVSILRTEFRWFRVGEFDEVTWLLVVLVSLISALALVLWALWTNYLGIASAMIGSFKSVPLWFMLLVGIPGFALVNAFAEEAVYRGVLQNAFEKHFPSRPWLVIGAQASAFAAAHYQNGFPNGKLGYLMTFTFACMLGLLRRRTEGMLAPYIAHVAADAVIGFTLLLLAA